MTLDDIGQFLQFVEWQAMCLVKTTDIRYKLSVKYFFNILWEIEFTSVSVITMAHIVV